MTNKVLIPGEIIELELIEIVEVTHDTKRFRFGFPNKSDILGYRLAKAFLSPLMMKMENKFSDHTHQYLPIMTQGLLTLL